ncbi:MAG: heparan-alpha-glucosaminide N-acetyltransferase domain-containing protein [Vicinamibacterales bacterium]
MSDPKSSSSTTSGTHAHRVMFVDLTRALAVVLMISGHTVSGLLDPAYTSAPWFPAWQFQRGLTSSLFLLLSGFAFGVATSRRWASHVRLSPSVFRRLRRFAFFVALGYTVHMPVRSVRLLSTLDNAAWRSFVAVDVLQLIGVTFIAVQVLVFVCRTQRAFTAISLVLAAVILAITPAAWDHEWNTLLPSAALAYLTPTGGSPFPLLPFASSVLIGVGLGQLYAHWGSAHLRSFANVVLLGGAVLFTVPGLLSRYFSYSGASPSGAVPLEYLLRTGVSFAVLAVIAHASIHIRRLPGLVGAVAQESLIVYYVHLCVVYGSIWTVGLRQLIDRPLTLGQAVPTGLALTAVMAVLAWLWHRLKRNRPKLVSWIKVATAAWAAFWLY